MKIDGRILAQTLLENLETEVTDLKQKEIVPHLAVILVGDDPASHAYVRQKKLKGESIGIRVSIYEYASDITEQELLDKIRQLNKDPDTHGIIIQQPLPDNINPQTLVSATDPRKDVDGFHENSSFAPPIADAVLETLKYIASQNSTDLQDYLRDKKIVVVGKGPTGGNPIKEMLEKNGASPEVIDSKTQNPEALTQEADIIISCVGKQGVLKKENLKKGVVLISVGMLRGTDGKLHGDYEEEEIADIASFYTPVPGGVGPVNVAKLLTNTVKAAQN